MTNRLLWLGLAVLTALLSAGVTGCGETTEVTTKGRCAGVVCGTDQTCDPSSGVCMCGGPGGVFCKAEQECSLDPSPHCFSSKCQFTICERGESCDRETGECGCGGERCEEGETCVDERCRATEPCDDTLCGDGLSCDPVDGACKCFGVECGEGESCLEGKCTFDRCSGVNCTTNSACNQADGACHCGGFTGPICQTGQACMKVEGVLDCVTSDLCKDNGCTGGTVCDPTDGLCHCGGVGELAPVCNSEQTCIDGECRGGGLCPPVGEPSGCSADTSCDPADGACKCGGAGGVECMENESCTFLKGSFACASRCDIFGSPTGCAQGEGCYFDSLLPSSGTFCGRAGTSVLNGNCSTATDCAPGLFCNPTANKCRKLCRPSQGNTGCGGLGGQGTACAQIPNGPADTGYCISDS